MELCLSWWFVGDHHLFDLWLRSSKFFWSWGRWTSPLVGLWFQLQSLTHVSSIATSRYKNSWPSTSNLCFSKVAMLRRFCFCSAIKQWGTNRTEIFLFFKPFVRIWNIDVGGIPVVLESSSHVARRSSSGASDTSFTLRSSVDVFGLPGLGSSFMLTRPPRKRLAQRDCTTVHC